MSRRMEGLIFKLACKLGSLREFTKEGGFADASGAYATACACEVVVPEGSAFARRAEGATLLGPHPVACG